MSNILLAKVLRSYRVLDKLVLEALDSSFFHVEIKAVD
jgi:hypothetical protein